MEKQTSKKGFMASTFGGRAMNSTVKSANTTLSESWLGYFIGPCLVGTVYCMLGGSYLTQFYTDVLGLSGAILVFMPFFSKIFDAFTNIVMGRIIDRTRTRQGKARPWIFMAGIFITVAGILLYLVPRASMGVQLAWVVVSYNLFFAFAYTIYNMSHTLMVPLSTRNTRQRDTLALMSNAGVSMIPGMIGNVIMPFVVAAIGVGSESQTSWITVMSIISIFAVPGALIEYYFTKERVTEEAMKAGETEEGTKELSIREQAGLAVHDRYWVIVMCVAVISGIANFLSTNSMVYFCNWVLADSVSAGANMQFLVNVIGQAPLGFGIFALWPLVRKFGKRRVIQVGFSLSAVGAVMVVCMAHMGIGAVLIGLIIKSIGGIPCYVITAQLAEALDHIEWQHNKRVDGFSASIYSIIATVSNGVGQSILLGGINLLGYIKPESADQIVNQPAAMQNFFIFCFAGANIISNIVIVLLMTRFDVENKMPQISADIVARCKEAAAARGEEYLSPEEVAEIEQRENDIKAEEARISELKAKCQKKGLSFDEEEAKYQAKLAAKEAKKNRKK